MRFAPWRSERCVAVATARSSLTKNKVGVRLDTSLEFLMKLLSAFVYRLWLPLSRLFLVLQISLRVDL